MEKGPYYLASPLKGTPEEEAARFQLSRKVTVSFLAQGIYVFSPLAYTQAITEETDFPSDEERRQVLMPYLLDFLKVSRGLILLTIPGWEDSWGVQQELEFCQKNDIPVYLLNPDLPPQNFVQILSDPLRQKEVCNLLEKMKNTTERKAGS